MVNGQALAEYIGTEHVFDVDEALECVYRRFTLLARIMVNKAHEMKRDPTPAGQRRLAQEIDAIKFALRVLSDPTITLTINQEGMRGDKTAKD